VQPYRARPGRRDKPADHEIADEREMHGDREGYKYRESDDSRIIHALSA
jgi:hypothetical protein